MVRPFAATGALLKEVGSAFSKDSVDKVPYLSSSGTGRRGWTEIVLTSGVPLAGEQEIEAEVYRYAFLFRKGQRGRGLLLGIKSTLVYLLLERLGIVEKVQAPAILVDAIVNEMTGRPGDQYVLGAVFARVEGYGASLRNMSFYGDDLAATELFKSLLSSLSPFRIALKQFGTRSEVLSVGSRGEISFQFKNAASLDDVDAALLFLSRQGFISWERSFSAEISLRH